MLADPQDTIVALSSAPGPGARAIVRLSGPQALVVVAHFFQGNSPLDPDQRHCYAGQLILPELHSPLPADVYVWPAPRTYTGQVLVEVHALASPPLVELFLGHCLSAGARAAQPGEFTLRAFLAGKLDLTRAEAVLAVIEADSRAELTQALAQLAGGVTRPLQELRQDLLDLLADVEAGLDFSDVDISFVQQRELLQRVTRGLALITGLRQQLDRRAVTETVFRVVLAGRPNAGKSSLFNALGQGRALVSHEPGTTRDYLVQRLDLDGLAVDLVDTAGWQTARNGLEGQAQELGQEQLNRADLVLLCVAAGQATEEQRQELAARTGTETMIVLTKCDVQQATEPHLATSAATGQGLSQLRTLLREQAQAQTQPALAPSLSRCRGHVDTCLKHLRLAHQLVLEDDPPELLALELRGALEQLGAMVGAIYTEDLLDRIFSRFCIGK
jgi:tRNA modification GTPase